MSDVARLRNLWRRLREMELAGAADLPWLAAEFAAWKDDPRPELAKLDLLIRHLKPGISARTLADLLVPVERALDKNLRDEDLLVTTNDVARTRETLPLRLVLVQLRSALNVGSLIRSAEGLGVEKIHFVGYTPTPDDLKVSRSSMGAHVEWESHRDFPALPDHRLVALETAPAAAEMSVPLPRVPTALVLGNERFGLASADLKACAEIRQLRLRGVKNSLNVAVAGAIAMHEWARQWRSP